MTGFKDHFSERAAAYAAHRPVYPRALVDFLAEVAPRRDVAWDCGCGSGQLSVLLADRFARVVATDASAEQIAQATPHPKIGYRCARAEASGLPDGEVDLAVAAQAAHWLDLAGYYAEVRRVARPGAALALVSYGLVQADDDVAPLVHHFFSTVLRAYWPPERRYVDDGYRSLPFPFEEITAAPLEIQAQWTLANFEGYVETISAVRALEQAQGPAPLARFRRELARVWGAEGATRRVRWPLALRVGRV